MKKQKSNRRDFVKKSLSVAAGISIIPRHVMGGTNFLAPSDQLTKAIIGAGGMGQSHIRKYTDARLLAVCDADQHRVDSTVKKNGNSVKGYRDFREVLQRPDIDIVHIVTPPHWHGIMSVMAAEAGKDIWCEKPMTRTIGEGKRVIEAMKVHGTMFRLNTWFRFQDTFYGMKTPVKNLKKAVDSGVLGWPLKVTISGVTGFDWKFYWVGKENLKPQAVPDNLDYNMWLGPAPEKAYHPHRVHGTFRGYWDYDGGGLGDMGQHYIDPVQYFLGKDNTSPVKVEVDAPQQHYDAVGTWSTITYTYADGCQIILDGDNRIKDAAYIEGPDGKIFKGFESTVPNLKEMVDNMPDPEEQISDFIESVKTRKKFALNEENGHRSCTIVNMGVIALRLGRTLEYNPAKQEFINDEAANRLIDQPLRESWRL